MIKWIIDYPSPFSENLNAIEWKGQAAHCEHQVYRLDSKSWTVQPRAIRVQEMPPPTNLINADSGEIISGS